MNHVQQLHFADRRPDAADSQAVVTLHFNQLLDFAIGQLHDVLDPVTSIDKADRIILQAQRGKGRILLYGEFLVGRLVGEPTQ